MIKFLETGAAALALAGVVGCAAPAYDVYVYLSPQLKETYRVYPSLEVDLVGMDSNVAERFTATSVEEYFRVGGALRRSTPHATLRFGMTDVYPKCLDGDDKIWEAFEECDADKLCILVNLPPASAPAEGEKTGAVPKTANADGRKLIVALEKDCFLNPRRWFCWPSRHFEVVPVGINARNHAPAGAEKPVTVTMPPWGEKAKNGANQ